MFIKENRGSFSTCLGKIRFFGKPTHALTVTCLTILLGVECGRNHKAGPSLISPLCLFHTPLLVVSGYSLQLSQRDVFATPSQRAFHRRKNKEAKAFLVQMVPEEDSVKISIYRTTSKHLSCSKLREQLEAEDADDTQHIAYEKRKLDAVYVHNMENNRKRHYHSLSGETEGHA